MNRGEIAINQALYSIDQCTNCFYESKSNCPIPDRRTSARHISSQIDSEGNYIPTTEGLTKENKRQAKQNIQRLQSPCRYFRQKFNNQN
jgi:hypothetical protein